MDHSAPATPMRGAALIDSWLGRHLKAEVRSWLDETCARLAAGAPARTLYLAFGAAARRAGRADLDLDAAQLAAAGALVPGWQPTRWSCDQAVRTRLVLALPSADPAAWLAALDALFNSSGMEEQVALYQALAIFPHPHLLRLRAAEGLRSSMKPVFEAVALDNPYIAAQLDDHAFNQAVVKAVFVGAPLPRIHGLLGRANADLTRSLCDLTRERWAAKRTITPEIWPVIVRHPRGDALALLARAARSEDPVERAAAQAAAALVQTPAAPA